MFFPAASDRLAGLCPVGEPPHPYAFQGKEALLAPLG
jgi:hypothetical protein